MMLPKFFHIDFSALDRRVVYVLVLIALGVPMILGVGVKPARMKAAEKFFLVVEGLTPQPGKLVFVSLDFGPNSMAENVPQSEVVLEHLMRKRIPFMTYSQYPLAEPFLESIPGDIAKRLMREMPTQKWEYGVDWINVGYRPSGIVMLQNMSSSEDLAALLKKDARGNSLRDLPAFKGVYTLNDIIMLVEFTSLVGTLDAFLQFFKRGDFRPVFGYGCTSITIPQAFIYLDSGQLSGLLEGIAGAAWYSTLLSDKFPNRKIDKSILINTGLGIAHLVVILLVILGNVAAFWRAR